MRWFRKATATPDDLSAIPETVEHFQAEYEQARQEILIKGTRIDGMAARVPGLIEFRFAQYQEIETILEWVEKVKEREVIRQIERIHSHYARALSDTNARKHAEASDEVFAIECIRLEVATVRNNYLALFKGIEALHYQIRNIVELRKVGLDEATF